MPAGGATGGSNQPASGQVADPRGPLPPGYVPRRPAETVLYALVRDHLDGFLDHARETYDRGLPHYVERAFRTYLTCGMFAHGFLRFHCDDCGRDLLVAFSCKNRDLCPSCGARRMSNTAAHLVDRVLPAVPVRQWVLSLPFELRRLAAFRADVATALGRIFIKEVVADRKRGAGLVGAEPGAVNFLQRFGGSLNLNLHFHAIVLDGVFARDGHGALRFHDTGAPTEEELAHLVRRVRDRSPSAADIDGMRGIKSFAALKAMDAASSKGSLAPLVKAAQSSAIKTEQAFDAAPPSGVVECEDALVDAAFCGDDVDRASVKSAAKGKDDGACTALGVLLAKKCAQQ